MGATPTGAPSGLQQHLVSGDWLFATLPDVWEASALVIVHHLMHLLPCSISFRMEAACRSLTLL